MKSDDSPVVVRDGLAAALAALVMAVAETVFSGFVLGRGEWVAGVTYLLGSGLLVWLSTTIGCSVHLDEDGLTRRWLLRRRRWPWAALRAVQLGAKEVVITTADGTVLRVAGSANTLAALADRLQDRLGRPAPATGPELAPAEVLAWLGHPPDGRLVVGQPWNGCVLVSTGVALTAGVGAAASEELGVLFAALGLGGVALGLALLRGTYLSVGAAGVDVVRCGQHRWVPWSDVESLETLGPAGKHAISYRVHAGLDTFAFGPGDSHADRLLAVLEQVIAARQAGRRLPSAELDDRTLSLVSAEDATADRGISVVEDA